MQTIIQIPRYFDGWNEKKYVCIYSSRNVQTCFNYHYDQLQWNKKLKYKEKHNVNQFSIDNT